ncbi:hypothetical protein SAMN04487904_106227 [Actinopolyspora lacussalsi subsp. righensis]|uniref:Uncharacterized protein n=1 Tax=Actinopolyspora righensis TaxID=995060 RepID=A0A1I7ABQ4_9ACTN|nr:hypothetical protein [Actinopolyspora righensis]SFT72240.1 hypothetical protein SAMN04487904_106227 [Actinopolyspora righensis]
MASIRIASGATSGSGWETHGNGVKLDVNTSDGNFTNTPVYTISVGGGGGNMWELSGGTSAVYDPTPTGFRVYLLWRTGGPLTAQEANDYGWYVNWIGIEE